MRRALAVIPFVLFAAAIPLFAANILFDASHHEMAGNADWVVDADAWNLNMQAYPCSGTTNEANPGRYPTPDQSGITASTPETFWTGGISSWGIELAKAGHTIETLPDGGRITYGDNTNAQDLSHYQLFIVVEPNTPFTASEKAAILAFVNAGGGLFMVGDHETSDRDCDGWESPKIWNDLTGATSTTNTGTFGIWMRELGSQSAGAEDWFDDGTDNNVSTDPADPVIHGPFGDGTGGLGLFGATSMDIDTSKATAHVWRTGQTHNNLRVTFATASYGAGRVAAIGDSSPADDGTGDSGDTLYGGWDKAAGGVNNREIHLNACAWLLNTAPDTTPPVITSGPTAAAADCSATITWTTDEAATSGVAYGTTTAYGNTASTAGHSTSHSVVLTGLVPSATYHYQVSSTDAAGNGPTQSSDRTFATTAGAAPLITVGPLATTSGGTSSVVTWTTNEAATSQVEYGLTASYGSSSSVAGYDTAHAVTLAGLAPETTYHYRVLSSDSCGNGPTYSPDDTFTTGPASLDISGWVLKQFNSTQTFTFPAGTTIPSGGYLVLGRDATRAEFEAVFPSMPATTVYLDSNAAGSCTGGCFPLINGAETFELWNGATKVDGTTVAMSAGNAYQRKNPGDPAGVAGSWATVGMASANPGQGAGTGSGAGVVINEMADASAWADEFIELYYDAGAAQADTTPPAAATDLSALALSDTQIRLTWTAPGDDGNTGTAVAYDLRMNASPITSDAIFNSSTQIPGLPAPSGAGSVEQFVVTGLAASTTYHFAIKTRDEVPNWSAISNDAPATTASSTDITPPAPISDLTAIPLSDTSIKLTWTATGDDGGTGKATAYDIRMSASRITSEAEFAVATPLASAPAPDASGTPQQFTVTGLTADTPYYFAMKVRDEVPNWSGLSNFASAVTGPAGGGGPAPVNHLVISQFRIAGSTDDFVELYNPTSSAIPLTNYTIRNLSAAGNTGFSVPISGSVASHGWYLAAGSGYSGTPTPDASLGSNNFSGTAGHILLVSKTASLSPACSDTAIVDKVGYASTATCPEGGSGHNATAPGSGLSCTRKPGGTSGNGQDTDDNAADFLAPATPSIHNGSSTPATPPSGVGLGHVGGTLYLTPGASGTSLGWANAANATSYNIYRGTTPDFMGLAPAAWKNSTSNTTTDPSAPAPVLYYVVRATDGVTEND